VIGGSSYAPRSPTGMLSSSLSVKSLCFTVSLYRSRGSMFANVKRPWPSVRTVASCDVSTTSFTKIIS
jgi:hypothetical protein